jgi:hypothetical protein
LQFVDQLPTGPGYADKVTIWERRLYVANDFAGFLIYDVHSPDKPSLIEAVSD